MIFLAAMPGALASQAFASQPSSSGAAETCAVVSDFSGAVQILNPSRTDLHGAVKLSSVPCGGWVSVGSGWARIRHREGFTLHLSARTFVQLPDGATRDQIVGDSLVLLKGQVYGNVSNGATPLQMMSANSRVRVDKGAVILIYDQETELTQVISLEGEAKFENRYQGARKVTVGPGESSELSLGQLRVIPATPKAMAAASIKTKFEELHLNERQRERALQHVVARAERKFVTAGQESGDRERKEPQEPSRRLAGIQVTPSAAAAAAALKNEEEEKAAIRSHLTRKVAGGEKAGEKILFPGGEGEKLEQVQVEIRDPAGKVLEKNHQFEDKEKRRLIEELSKLRIE
jgi:hypothetical protein